MTESADDTASYSLRTGQVGVDGAILQYTVEGEGRPVMVIGSSVYYPRTFSSQLRRSCELAFIDLRHFAAKVTNHDVRTTTISTYADDIERVRSELGFQRAVLIGHSHHGNMALEYAKRYPERVSHLVLIGSPPCDIQRTLEGGSRYWDNQAGAERKARLRLNRQALEAKQHARKSSDQAFVDSYVADGPLYWNDASYDGGWLWQDVPIDMTLIQRFKSFFVDYAFGWDPARMSAPVLVLMGRHDYIVPHTLWDEARPALPELDFRLLEHSGHTPQLEEPDVFDRLLLAWLKQTDAE